MQIKSILLLTLLTTATCSQAQDSTKTKVKKNRKVKVLPVPALGVSPETSFYFGAVALFTIDLYQDSLTRASNAKLEFNYSVRKQAIAEAGWNYFFKRESWFTRGFFHYSKYIDFYYGIGPNTSNLSELTYETNRFIMDVDMLKQVYPKLFVGLGFRYLNFSNFKYYYQSNQFSELKTTDAVGFKLNLLHDRRNNILTTTEGRYQELSLGFNRGDENYVKLVLDAREYFTFKKNTFAARLYNSFTFGEAPFYDLSLIGGDRFARGYYFGRYRSNHLTALQFEYRSPMLWRLGLAVFGGVSSVYSTPAYLKFDTFKPNLGGGLRILFDKEENTSLRIDYAVGLDGQSGFYISFGESF